MVQHARRGLYIKKGRTVKCAHCGLDTYKQKCYLKLGKKRDFCGLSCWYGYLERKTKHICSWCGINFTRKNSHMKQSENHYCSQRCMGDAFKSRTKPKGECCYCGQLVYRHSVAANSKQLFCDRNCYIKYRNTLTGSRLKCKHCGKTFYRVPSSQQETCSKDCGYALLRAKRLLGQGKNQNREMACTGCGKSFIMWASKANKQKTVWCSVKCYEKFYRLDKTSSWKGGWYIHSDANRIMILIGKYIRGRSRTAYRTRSLVACEFYLDYFLPRHAQLRCLHLNNETRDDHVSNLYLCTHSEGIRIRNGSLPWPTQSNLPYIKAVKLYSHEDIDVNVERLPLYLVRQYYKDSMMGKIIIKEKQNEEMDDNSRNVPADGLCKPGRGTERT